MFKTARKLLDNRLQIQKGWVTIHGHPVLLPDDPEGKEFPDFKSTGEALAYGRKVAKEPKKLEAMQAKRDAILVENAKIKALGNQATDEQMNEGMQWSVKAQFLREALQEARAINAGTKTDSERLAEHRKELGLDKAWTEQARQASAEARRGKKRPVVSSFKDKYGMTYHVHPFYAGTKTRYMVSIPNTRWSHNNFGHGFDTIKQAKEFMVSEHKEKGVGFKTLSVYMRDRLEKGWTEQARQASLEARRSMAKPAKRKLKETEAFQYYVKIKEGTFGKNIQVILLNKKVGMSEGIAKAYRERAGKMKQGDKYKGKTRDDLLRTAQRLKDAAQTYASQRDSLLGRPAHKVLKQDTGLGEDKLAELLNSGEFDDIIRQEIEQEIGG